MANEANTTISIPAVNPSNGQNLAGLIDFIQRNIFIKLEKVAPAKIVSYDRLKNRAIVQVLNYSITSMGEKIERKPLNDIPVSVIGGGGFGLNFPIKAGDIGIIVACDCDISIFKKLLQIFTPSTYQKHRYKDSIFIPLYINGFSVATSDSEAVILSSVDGSTKIALKSNYVTISAQNTVINGNLTINGNVEASGTVTGNGIIDTTGANGTFANQVTVTNGIVKEGS